VRSPEVARALPELVRQGVLDERTAAPLAAVARGELVSVRAELRALLGLSVLALTTAVGLFLEEYHERIGPGLIALLLAAAAAGVLWAARRRAAPFTWGRAAEADWILDGLLLLAIGLVGAELGWVETQFGALGAHWAWHLLLLSAITGALAIRFDSISCWTVALSTFAAWRGISVAPSAAALERTLFRGEDALRWNLLVCALVFAALGVAAERLDRKRHFEPTTTFLAALAAGLALASGLGEASSWSLWLLALLALGTGVALLAFRRRRIALFALGALAIYVGVTRIIFELPQAGGIGCFWLSSSSVGGVFVLVLVQRHFRRGERE